MKKITRDMLRGKPLIHRRPLSEGNFDCDKARISKYEWGKEDPRQFCYGLVEWKDRDGECGPVCEECRKCRAWNSGEYCEETPWERDVEFNPKAKKRK